MNKYQRMLLGIAIGDACGAGYEFSSENIEDYQNPCKTNYVENKNRNFSTISPGMYTDDTQMSIAVAELLVSNKEFNRENLANKFVEVFKRDPINGYARGFQKFLEEVKSGEEFLEKIRPDSMRNGAAMRSVPFGQIHFWRDLVYNAVTNAQLTHNTKKGIASSVAIAMLAHYPFIQSEIWDSFLFNVVGSYDKETAEYLQKVGTLTSLDRKILLGEKHQNKGVPCDGMRTVGAVMYLLNNFHTAEDVLFESIKLGGDTDSVASIALGIFAINNSLDSLPEFLMRDLTNHEFGKDYLLDLGNELKEKFEN